MEFEWDPTKAATVERERGLIFDNIAELFEKPHVIIDSSKMGEERWRIVGQIDDICVTGVFTRRGDSFRIITARRSWRSEEREYRALHDRGNP
jgi:uncharacterized protein